MVEIEAVYEGELHTMARHGPSGAVISTDAPKDNEGKGEAFSPTDLVGTALGTCMLTIMGIVARRRQLDLRGARVKVAKQMAAAPVRRIKRLEVVFQMPKGLSAEDRGALEAAAHACPVHQSLHPQIEVPLTFAYPD